MHSFYSLIAAAWITVVLAACADMPVPASDLEHSSTPHQGDGGIADPETETSSHALSDGPVRFEARNAAGSVTNCTVSAGIGKSARVCGSALVGCDRRSDIKVRVRLYRGLRLVGTNVRRCNNALGCDVSVSRRDKPGSQRWCSQAVVGGFVIDTRCGNF